MAGRRAQKPPVTPQLVGSAEGAMDLQSLREAVITLQGAVKTLLERVAKLEGP